MANGFKVEKGLSRDVSRRSAGFAVPVLETGKGGGKVGALAAVDAGDAAPG